MGRWFYLQDMNDICVSTDIDKDNDECKANQCVMVDIKKIKIKNDIMQRITKGIWEI